MNLITGRKLFFLKKDQPSISRKHMGRQIIQGVGLAVISPSASHVPEDGYSFNGGRGSAPLFRTIRVACHQIRKSNLRYEVGKKRHACTRH